MLHSSLYQDGKASVSILRSIVSGVKTFARETGLSESQRHKLLLASPPLNSAGFDDFGFHPETALKVLTLVRPIYDRYFRVETAGLSHVPDKRVLFIANHSGQIPMDGLLIASAMALYGEPPRFVRGMVERWVPSLPWVSSLLVRSGQIIGDPENCRRLLKQEQAVLVFPEGVRGSGKTYWKRYQLQRFGMGFMRLALETKTPIVPIAVIGAEEIYPSLHNAKTLARLLKTPYFPLTPTFPLLGPLGAIPLPTKIRLHFGKAMDFEGEADASDSEIEEQVKKVTSTLQALIDQGLAKRGMKIF